MRPDGDAVGTAAIMASTLSLMSCYARYPLPVYAERITCNLCCIAHCRGLSPELRTICRRLAERWGIMCCEGRQRELAGERAVDGRSLH